MAQEILVKTMHNGVEIVQLRPNQKMMAFAFAMTLDPACRTKSPQDILVYAGIATDGNNAKKILSRWRDDYNPYFDEWIEDVQTKFHPKNIRNMLEMVGLQEAMKGEFQFWKPFAIREKVIQPDQTNVAMISADLGAFNEWTEEQIKQHRDSLLAGLRAVGDQGPDVVDASAPPERPESDPRGAPGLQQESVALPESVGGDGERALDFEIDL